MEQLRLPTVIVGQSDVSRLIRELGQLNDFFVDAGARKTGTAMPLPKLSRLLDQLSRENKVNLLDGAARNQLLKSLNDLYSNAPCLHISFAIEPSPKAFEKILVWIRQNIHPQALVQIGLQPAISAGCLLRTPNRVFDLSLKASLNKQKPYLTQLIKGVAGGR